MVTTGTSGAMTAADYFVLLTARAVSLLATLADTGDTAHIFPDGRTLTQSAATLYEDASTAVEEFDVSLGVGCPCCGEELTEHPLEPGSEHPVLTLIRQIAAMAGNVAAVGSGELTEQELGLMPDSFGLRRHDVRTTFADPTVHHFFAAQDLTDDSPAYFFVLAHCLA
jgi:hypothetical protein